MKFLNWYHQQCEDFEYYEATLLSYKFNNSDELKLILFIEKNANSDYKLYFEIGSNVSKIGDYNSLNLAKEAAQCHYMKLKNSLLEQITY